MTVVVGGMERTWCFPERGVEGLVNGFGDGEWGNFGAVVDHSFGLAQ